MEHKFNYKWNLSDTTFAKDKGKVFSCFACGGGSTMGYKLAGFDVIGDNEIDPKMNEMYVHNHHPRINYLCDIRELVVKAQNHELEEELYNLDILDASFPCSSFSMAGNREKDWGKEKVFREGQKAQVLDTLPFDTIALTKELKPKVIIFENVKGLIIGKAKAYCEKILEELKAIGYTTTYKLVNGATMGIPQRRERVFFVGVREDIAANLPKKIDGTPDVNLEFNEPTINFGECQDGLGRPLVKKYLYLWERKQPTDKYLAEACWREFGKKSFFSQKILHKDEPATTLTGHEDSILLYDVPAFLSEMEVKKISSFPLDYDFMGNKPHYVCGMSVPPVMMAQVSTRVYQYLHSIK